jgi:hypothetical protein
MAPVNTTVMIPVINGDNNDDKERNVFGVEKTEEEGGRSERNRERQAHELYRSKEN